MFLTDVNVLVYAHRQDSPDHEPHRQWLEGVINGDQAYGVSDQVLAGFLRVVTHPSVFDPPSRLEDALEFVAQLRDRHNAVLVSPGPRHWEIFDRLCRETRASGNQIPDAFFAALAIESGSQWISTDQGFGRYDALDWRHPFQA